MRIALSKEYVEDLIKRGEKIGREEYHPSKDGFFPDYVDGPKYDIWMNEINIFNERYLIDHPVYKCISDTYQNHKSKFSAFDEMLGYLRALAEDNELFETIDQGKDKASMGFSKLPSNSEQLLSELLRSTNPTDYLAGRFQNISNSEDDELRGIIRELKDEGYIDVQWANNLPYYVTLNNSARTYNERLADYERTHNNQNQDQDNENITIQERIIFLSHKSDDKKYGDALRNFIIGLGVKDEQLIYTSHPLNKIPMDENIYEYLRKHIHSQMFMIILWSDKYLESPACLNEMGAAWVTQADYTNIYVPDFSFGSKYHECAVDTSKMGAVLNGDAICKASMIELKNKIIKLFDLEDNESKTSYLLDQFMESIKGERYEIIDGGTFGDS